MPTEKQLLDLNADELNDLYLEQYELLRSSDPEVVRNAQFMMDQIRWATDQFYSKKKTFREREPGMYKDQMSKRDPCMDLIGWLGISVLGFAMCSWLLLLLCHFFGMWRTE